MDDGWVRDRRRGRLPYRMLERWGVAKAAVAYCVCGFAAGSVLAIPFHLIGLSDYPLRTGFLVLAVGALIIPAGSRPASVAGGRGRLILAGAFGAAVSSDNPLGTGFLVLAVGAVIVSLDRELPWQVYLGLILSLAFGVAASSLALGTI